MCIELTDVTKDFVKESGAFHALQHVNLRIAPGENIALIGPNGAGKSTLLKLLVGLLTPTKGTVANSFASYGFQSIEFGLNRDMRVKDFLVFYGRLQNLDDNYIDGRITELANQLNFTDILERRIRTLSTGNAQKVALSRALIHRPELLILDEPMNGLDLMVSENIREVLRGEMDRGTTVVLCSHLKEDIALCNRIVVVSQGRLVRDDRLDESEKASFRPYDFFVDAIGQAKDAEQRTQDAPKVGED